MLSIESRNMAAKGLSCSSFRLAGLPCLIAADMLRRRLLARGKTLQEWTVSAFCQSVCTSHALHKYVCRGQAHLAMSQQQVIVP